MFYLLKNFRTDQQSSKEYYYNIYLHSLHTKINTHT